MQLFCQWTLASLIVFTLVGGLYIDSQPKTAAPAAGFAGNVGTLIVTALKVLLFYGAGAFSLIVGN